MAVAASRFSIASSSLRREGIDEAVGRGTDQDDHLPHHIDDGVGDDHQHRISRGAREDAMKLEVRTDAAGDVVGGHRGLTLVDIGLERSEIRLGAPFAGKSRNRNFR